MKEHIQQPHKNNIQENTSTDNRRQSSLSIIDNRPFAIQQKRILGYMTTTKNVLQCQKNIKIDEYILTIDKDDFEKEATAIFTYLSKKNLLEKFVGKKIHIQKAPGTQDQVCHHWAFGGLNSNFTLDINKIHELIGGSIRLTPPEDWLKKLLNAIEGSENLYDNFTETAVGQKALNGQELSYEEFNSISEQLRNTLSWDKVWQTTGGKLTETEVSTQIRVYDKIAHSSRYQGGIWWHKFILNEFIFGIEGGDDNLGYASCEEINVKAFPSQVVGVSSYFTYTSKE